jgi:GNAT superfamily N-acetyltransferase
MRILMRDGVSGVDDAFVGLPSAVYADDPCWIPEEASVVRSAFSSANDWFANGAAVTMCIRNAARLAVFRTRDCCVDGRAAAFFGYWEQRGDGSSSQPLFREAQAWARDQGAERLYGPINFTTHGAYRLLTHAEPGAQPFVGEPYNPLEYPALLESLGFRIARRYITQISDGPLDTRRIDLARRMLLDAGYTLTPLDGSRWRAMLPDLKPLVDSMFARNFAFTPISYESFACGYGESVARRMCPRTSLVAHGPGGDIAGFVLVYPDYSPLVAQSAGSHRVAPSALSFVEHAPLLERRRPRTAIVRTIGVAPQHRGRGLSRALGAAVVASGVAHYDRWIGALIRDDNPSRRFGDTQAHTLRRYALYVADLEEAES